ncbi:MAG: EF-P lysine aminoacylase EpmA [Rubripirellula sp.]
MHKSTRPNLKRLRERSILLRQLRQFFDERDFLEVQPPCLSRDCVIDPYIDPVQVPGEALQLGIDPSREFFLQTSPEAAMKRMLAAGAPSIYSLGPVFRAGELGDQHNVEFTMLEWYDVGADLDAGVELLGTLAMEILDAPGYDVRSYSQLFIDSIGIDPISADLDDVRREAGKIDAGLADSLAQDRDGLLDVILTHAIQPGLGVDRPLIVRDYPLSQAALAKRLDDDQLCAARFELFVSGVEIANGYDELRDPEVMLRRFESCNQKRARDGRRLLSLEIPLVTAMRDGLPACAGVALGVDRLLMVRTGEEHITNVMPFRIDSV